MRESEEYVKDSSYKEVGAECFDVVLLDNAEHAVKLAYKEGYLEAIEEALDNLTGYTELSSNDVEQILERIRKDFNK